MRQALKPVTLFATLTLLLAGCTAEQQSIRSVQQQKKLRGWTYADGTLTLTTELEWADHILLKYRGR